MNEGPIILFDGVCNLCNGIVNFIIARDRDAVFRFGSLQSPTGQRLLDRVGLPETLLSSIVLIADGRYDTESTAALKIARRLGLPWSLLYSLMVIPKPLRDTIYNIIARHRYALFGRSEQCRLPTPELRQRFLSWD